MTRALWWRTNFGRAFQLMWLAVLRMWLAVPVLGFGPLLPSRRAVPHAGCTVWCTVAAEDGRRPALPLAGGPLVRGTEDIMSLKQHGSTAAPVQAALRWDVDRAVADFVCSYNRDGAEPSGAFTRYQSFTQELMGAGAPSGKPVVFYDSVSGSPLFVAPRGRTVDDFLGESQRHGWPSFRQEEVVWENVRVLSGSEVRSTRAPHALHIRHAASCRIMPHATQRAPCSASHAVHHASIHAVAPCSAPYSARSAPAMRHAVRHVHCMQRITCDAF